MNRRELSLAAVTGAPHPRPPWSAMLSLYGARLSGRPLDEHYSNATAFCEGMQAVVEGRRWVLGTPAWVRR